MNCVDLLKPIVLTNFLRIGMQPVHTFSSKQQHLLHRIKSAVLAVEPGAEVYLYGSRARGDAADDSDWDILVILGDEVTARRKMTIWDALCDIEIETRSIITATVKNREDWSGNRLLQATPFYQNVSHDAVSL